MWTERQPGRRAACVPCDEGAGRPPAESAPARGPHSVQGDRCTSCLRSSQAPGCNRSPVREEALEDETAVPSAEGHASLSPSAWLPASPSCPPEA